MHDRQRTSRADAARRGLAVEIAIAAMVVVLASGSVPGRLVRAGLVLAVGVAVARAQPRANRSSAFVGIVAATAGAGLAVPHLTKGGDVLITLAAVVLAVDGSVLAVLAVRAAMLRRRSWRRAVPVLGALAGVFLATQVVALPVAATNVPRTSLAAATPADARLDYEDVTVPTRDGIDLSAWYLPAASHAAVVLLHGSGSTRSSTLDHAVVLARAGFAVLAIDARGHGRSDGRAMDLGWYGDDDVSAAVDWLADRPEIDDDRIGVVGLSMGGEEAIGAAASDARIAVVVAEGATGRVAADFGWLSDSYGLRGVVQEGIERVRQLTTDVLTDASPPRSLRSAVEAAAPRPVLLVAAGSVDEEVAAAAFIEGGSPASVDTWVVTGAGHTGGLATDRIAWETRVVGFLDAALNGGGEP